MINSQRVKFTFKFSVEDISYDKSVKKYKRRTPYESFVFMFGPRLTSIASFQKSATVFDAMGIGLVFRRNKKNKRQMMFLKEFHTASGLYNLQASYREKAQGKYTCDVNYLNTSTNLTVDFNFKTGMAGVFVNNNLCFNYIINRNVFPEEKLSYTFFGYNKASNPVKVAFEDILVRKLVEKGLSKRKKESFHASPKMVIDHIQNFDGHFMKNASLTNVVMVNGKIRNELRKMDGSIDLLAQRSKDIDALITEEEKLREQEKSKQKEDNALPTYVDLESFVGELKKVWNFNQKINDKFVSLKQQLSNFDELNQLFDKMDDMQTMVGLTRFPRSTTSSRSATSRRCSSSCPSSRPFWRTRSSTSTTSPTTTWTRTSASAPPPASRSCPSSWSSR